MEATLLSPGNDTLEATASAHLNMASSHTSMAALAPQLTNTGMCILFHCKPITYLLVW